MQKLIIYGAGRSKLQMLLKANGIKYERHKLLTLSTASHSATEYLLAITATATAISAVAKAFVAYAALQRKKITIRKSGVLITAENFTPEELAETLEDAQAAIFENKKPKRLRK